MRADAARAAIERALDAADPAIRCYLLYGPDESGSRALAARLARALGPDAERIDLSAAQVEGDPARLADEAASVSLFGGARHIRVEGATERTIAAVAALLDAPAAGNPAVVIAGALKKDSKLAALVAGHRAGLACQSRAPEGEDAARLAANLAREAGLRVDPDLARRLADASGGDRAVLAGEIAKLALYLDAAPDRVREAGHDDWDAIGAGAGEADLSGMLAALFGGDRPTLDVALARLAADGRDGIPVVRAALGRALVMAAARGAMARGAAPKAAVDAVARHLFWREKEAIAAALPRWSAARLAGAVERLAAMERTLKSSRGPGPIAADALFHAMARSVRP